MLLGKGRIYRWLYNEIEAEKIRVLTRGLRIDKSIAKILLNRGISGVEDAIKFLRSDIKDLLPPETMKDMDKVVERVISAIKNREVVFIYGDYDVDGITSISLLLNFFRTLNMDVFYYIPDRQSEGYGLNKDAIDKIVLEGAKLIISVDCGISAREEIIYAREKYNVDIIVIDHHRVVGDLPAAYAILDPYRDDCEFAFKPLAAVGVVFYFLIALRKRLREIGLISPTAQPNLKDYLDLVALGTVADIMPLRGENRILVKHGLRVLNKNKRIGLSQLIQSCAGKVEKISSKEISYRIAPRLNAAGRIEDPRYAVQLLTTDDPEVARKLVAELNNHNSKRQRIEEEIFRQAIEQIDRSIDLNSRSSIVLYSDNWHLGVIGIVASKISRKFNKPTILFSVKDGIAKGSGRSVGGFDLIECIKKCSSYLLEYGGHKSAVGLSLNVKNLDDFIAAFESVAQSNYQNINELPDILVDDILEPQDIGKEFFSKLEQLAPFGNENPEPVFYSEGYRVVSYRYQKGAGILQLKKDSRQEIGLIWIEEEMLTNIPERINIIYTPFLDNYLNTEILKLKILDFSKA
ncbi:MAG: single-stranded-DNA-specific exonuclease RecJ [Deltaproteobacteria bacterium]|nr:single-stranded-DNA-specific exonuclease RecJ [Deltaproteobacteria bacterium]